jgi:hypothetical protein
VSINAHPEDWGSSFRLMADVNLVDTDPELIAPIGNRTVPFSGVFDGNDFAIENFVLHSDTLNDVGIFGVVSTQAMQDRIDPNGLGRNYIFEYGTYEFDASEAVVHVQDLDIVNASVSGKNNVGVLAARCYGSIQRCRVTDAHVVNSGTVSTHSLQGAYEMTDGVLVMLRLHGRFLSSAGMVGHLAIGNLVDCHVSSGLVDGAGFAGGLAGFVYDSSVTSCSAQGSISGGDWTGGLAGYVRGSQVKQCGAEVSISGRRHVGGLIGKAAQSDIAECRALGQLLKDSGPGGFIGSSISSFVTNCYARCSIAPSYFAGGLIEDSSGDVVKFCYSACHFMKYVPRRGEAVQGSFIGTRGFSVARSQATEGSFWDRDISEVDVGVNYKETRYTDLDLPYEEIYGGSTQEMWTQKIYTDVGWDFETIWTIEEGLGYPVLKWESSSTPDSQ